MVQLATKPRNLLGRKAKRLRKQGEIPAVVYGYKIEPTNISVDARAFKKLWREAGETSLVELALEGTSPKQVLIHEVEMDPMSGVPIHVDFYAVQMDKEIEASIPLKLTGDSEAVKALGGVLLTVMHEIPVKALPKDLPHEILVDVTPLKTFEDKILVSNLVMPKGVEVMAEAEQVVLLVEPPRTEEEMAALDETQAPSVEDIEVVGAKEKAEAEAAEAAEESKAE